MSAIGEFLCNLIDDASGRQALRSHFQTAPHFCSVLLSPVPPKSTAIKSSKTGGKRAEKDEETTTKTADVKATKTATTKRSEKEDEMPVKPAESDEDSNVLPEPILLFLIILFRSAEKQPKDSDLIGICNHVWSWVESGALQRWLISANNNYYKLGGAAKNEAETPAAPSAAPSTSAAATEPTNTPATGLYGYMRKRKERKAAAAKAKIVFDSPFIDPDLVHLNFLTSGFASSSKNKSNEASVLDEDVDEDSGKGTSLGQQQSIFQTWSLVESMAQYASSQDSLLAKGQCASLLRSLEAVGNVAVANAAAASTPEEGCKLLDPLTTLLPIMTSLAEGAAPHGHFCLFHTAALWLQQCKQIVLPSVSTSAAATTTLETSEDLDSTINTVSSISSIGGDKNKTLEPLHLIMTYLSDILVALKVSNEHSKTSDGEPGTSGGEGLSAADNIDSDMLDDHNNEEDEDDEDDLAQEDSDEESICNKLCTYTHTQKEFVNQHWYHCHSCQMEDGVGVCSICAKVCHKGHDVTYAKYGSFFCDCGAKEDGSCQALVKRSPSYSNRSPAGEEGEDISSTVRRLALSPGDDKKRTLSTSGGGGANTRDQISKHRQALSKQIEGVGTSVSNYQLGLFQNILQLTQSLLPTLEDEAQTRATLNSVNTNRKALHSLHTATKGVQTSDQLMFATLGSQEGAFDNVRLNYSGEQGQTIRQLVATNAIRRVAMCCLASSTSRRQHLVVAHEKGKITLLHLSSLLKQKEAGSASGNFGGASKRKLSINRLTSAPVPFLVLSVTANPSNDDYLAVCGLKDCHVLVISQSGAISDHLVLHPHLDSGSYIIKALWLPGEQTQLAVVTADFVKIYDLSTDALSPQYYLLLPSGKIRDACFASLQDGSVHLILMTSSGYIYTQELNEDSSAKHGSFYVTNVLTVDHAAAELKDVSGVVGGGGVSVYYSHGLQLLCFSYSHGRSFMAPLTQLGENAKLEKLFPINVKPSANNVAGLTTNNGGSANSTGGSLSVTSSSASSASPGSSSKMSPLCQWSEVQGHPGLFTCLMLHSNAPVVIFVKPESIMVQEIKNTSSKSKVIDLVALRHTQTSESRTTLLLLCEDGSLRIFTAYNGATDFWLNSSDSGLLALPGANSIASLRNTRKKKVPKHSSRNNGPMSFSVDFFEHCSPSNDVKFGGSDLLQVYNVMQLRSRLQSQSTYVACSKPGGFQLEVVNKDSHSVICGLRVAVGGLDDHKNPSFISVFGRTFLVNTTRSRWYDIPLSRDESIRADKKLTVTFGPSTDPSQITIVDTVKIYVRTKEEFGWPDDEEYTAAGGGNTTNTGPSGTSTTTTNNRNNDTENGDSSSSSDADNANPSDSILESLFCSSLDALDGCFSINSSANSQYRQQALDIVARMINLNLAPRLQSCTRSLLSSLHDSRLSYHQQLDGAQLSGILDTLNGLIATGQQDPTLMDCQTFHNVVVMAREVAVARPHNLVR